MNLIERLDKWIFRCLCGFALMVCINAAIADFFTGVAFLLTLLRSVKKIPEINIPKQYIRAIGIFLLTFFLLIFFNEDILVSFKAYWRYLNRMIPLFIILAVIRDKNQIISIFLCLLIGLTINNSKAVYEGAVSAYEGQAHVRASGFNHSIIELAGCLLICLPVLIILFLNRKLKKWKSYIVLSLVISIIAFLLNGTRIAWLIMLGIFPYILYEKMNNVKKIGSIFLIFIFTFGIISYSVPALQNRVGSIISIHDASNRGHFFIVIDSLKMIVDFPITGVGLGEFHKIFNANYISEKTMEIETKGVNHAHNTILTIGAESGFIGVSAFCFMFGSFLFYSWRGWKKEKIDVDLMFFIITLAHLLQGLTDFSFGLHQTMKIYFCLLGLYLQYRYNDIQV